MNNWQGKDYFWCHFLALRILGVDFYIKSPKTASERLWIIIRLLYNFAIQSVVVFAFTILEMVQMPLLINEKERFMSNACFTLCHTVSMLKVIFFVTNRNALKDMADMLERDMLKYRQDNELLKSAIKISIFILLMFFCIISAVCTCGTLNSVADQFVFIEGVNATKNVSTYLPYEVSCVVTTIGFSILFIQINVFLINKVYSLWTPVPGWKYNLAYTFQLVGLVYGGLFISATDSIFCAFMLHMRCQFDILCKSFAYVDIIAMKR